jgi:hypothetical protein
VAASFTRRSTVTAIRIGPPAGPDVAGVELAVTGRVVLGADVCGPEPGEQAVPAATTPQTPYAHRDHIVVHGPRGGGALARNAAPVGWR